MDIDEIKTVLLEGEYDEKIEMLSYLCDVFESYNQNVDGLEETLDFLIKLVLESEDGTLKDEILEAICKAVIYKNIDNVDFDPMEQELAGTSISYIPRFIDILSFTHNKKYIDTILQFAEHANEDVRIAVKNAKLEMSV